MPLKLSAPRSRADLIAEFTAAHPVALATPPPPPAPAADAPDETGTPVEDALKTAAAALEQAATAVKKAQDAAGDSDEPTPPAKPAPKGADLAQLAVAALAAIAPAADTPDGQVATALRGVRASVQAAITAQAKDPDKQDPADVKIVAALNALLTAVDAAIAAQDADTDTTAIPDPKPPAPDAKLPGPSAAAPPAAPADSPTNNVISAAAALTAALAVTAPSTGTTDDGDVDPNSTCARPDCGHLASLHGDTDLGTNTGACTSPGCECEEFLGANSTAQADQPDDTDSNGADGLPEPDSNEFAAPVAGDAPAPPAELNLPPALDPDDDGAMLGPAFTIPVGIIEGQPTGDGRFIELDALTWRVPPIPLMGQDTSPHGAWDPNDPAVLCGRIESVTRIPGEGDTQVIACRGHFLATDDGVHFADLVEQMGRVGVSGDVYPTAETITLDEDDNASASIMAGELMGITITPFAAFQGAYIVLGDGTDQAEATAIPEAAEMPAIVAAGGQLIHYMTFEECDLCDPTAEVIVAAGAPAAPPAAWFENPRFEPGDGRMAEILTRDGRREHKFACPLTVTADGHVYGHIAPFGVCHTGLQGQCVLAPRSAVDYAHFKRGQVVTAEGDRVRVGMLTAGAGHADRTAVAASAMAHYDNTALQAAYVNIGEDEHGIWVAGAIAPGATPAQVATLRASSISGDWRKLGGQLELVAALAVNSPGFPVAMVASGGPASLVAAGAQTMALLKTPHVPEPQPAAPSVFERALAPLLDGARQHTRERRAAMRR